MPAKTTQHATFRLNSGVEVYSADGGESPWQAVNRTQAERRADLLREEGIDVEVYQSVQARQCFYLRPAEASARGRNCE